MGRSRYNFLPGLAGQQTVQDRLEMPEDFGKGRRCRKCGAYLCRYNPEPICWAHQPGGEGVLIEVAPGEWRRFEPSSQPENLADLMAEV